MLEIEKVMTELSRLNQIVVGLPNEIQNKLGRSSEKIETTEELMKELRKHEYGTTKKLF